MPFISWNKIFFNQINHLVLTSNNDLEDNLNHSSHYGQVKDIFFKDLLSS